jgi:hypothetical protein
MLSQIKLWYWWNFIINKNIYDIYQYWETYPNLTIQQQINQEQIILYLADGYSVFDIPASKIKEAGILI